MAPAVADLDGPTSIDVPNFTFGLQQERVLKDVETWYSGWRRKQHKRQVFKLFGFAGTGKTTLAKHLAASVDGKVCFAAYTGKAALMMQHGGCPRATTIHKLLYRIEFDDDGRLHFAIDRKARARSAALLVIDECSMVEQKLGLDLLSLGVPILVLGDPAQLPPVNGNGFFTSGKPDGMLTDIHRQARDNPIIRFASDVRLGNPLPYGEFGTVTIGRRGERSVADIVEADQIIVGRNATRISFNRRIRDHLGRDTPLPVKGDRLVCLRNDLEAGVLNGGLFNVQSSRQLMRNKQMIRMKLASEDFDTQASIAVECRREFFEGTAGGLSYADMRNTQQFDYGYALTAHKSQGSQWRHVVAYDESAAFGRDARRWLYTVMTRASEQLTLVR